MTTIIERLNERLGTEYMEEDGLFFAQVKRLMARDKGIRELADANDYEHFADAIRERVYGFMLQCLLDYDATDQRYRNDPDFEEANFPILARKTYEAVWSGEPR